MMIDLAGSAILGERVGGAGALRPDRPSAERARPGRPATIAGAANAAPASPRLERATHFSIHQLVAETPELGRAPPSLPRTLAAYRVQLAQRIHYSGPIAPVDLRV
jgi:hypothetical protein